jgi:hypothetical protein
MSRTTKEFGVSWAHVLGICSVQEKVPVVLFHEKILYTPEKQEVVKRGSLMYSFFVGLVNFCTDL